MNLWMTTVFTNADICTVGTCFTVDDTMSYLGLLWRKDDTYQDILDKNEGKYPVR